MQAHVLAKHGHESGLFATRMMEWGSHSWLAANPAFYSVPIAHLPHSLALGEICSPNVQHLKQSMSSTVLKAAGTLTPLNANPPR